jgi:hypothetical protein
VSDDAEPVYFAVDFVARLRGPDKDALTLPDSHPIASTMQDLADRGARS